VPALLVFLKRCVASGVRCNGRDNTVRFAPINLILAVCVWTIAVIYRLISESESALWLVHRQVQAHRGHGAGYGAPGRHGRAAA
jgi:uncharacterized membrane protein